MGKAEPSDNNLPEAPFLLYAGPDGVLRPDVFYAADNVWLSGDRIADIFAVSAKTAHEHIQSIYRDAELDPHDTMRTLRLKQGQGREVTQHDISLYSLDIIIAVSYRIQSSQAVRFRRWATRTLRSYMVQGFAIDGERLRQGEYVGQDYAGRLLERTTDIRTSERSFYQKVTSLYATATDHNQDAEATRDFYRTVQNKLHYAVHGYTAPEIVARRADANKPHMGLTTWSEAPAGEVRKADIHVAKNYLSADELQRLNRIVASYLDYAETQAARRRAKTMHDWEARLDAFLEFYECPKLDHKSRITPEAARSIAEQEYDAFRRQEKALVPRDS